MALFDDILGGLDLPGSDSLLGGLLEGLLGGDTGSLGSSGPATGGPSEG